MKPIDRSLLQIFSSEQAEHISRIRTLLQELGEAQESLSPDSFDELQRRAHTLKGAARAVGLEATETLIHRLETIFSKFRQGEAPFTPQRKALVERALEAIEDILSAAIADIDHPDFGPLSAALDAFPAELSVELAPPVTPARPDRPVSPAVAGDLVRVSAGLIDDLVRSSSQLLVSAVLDAKSENPFFEHAQFVDQVREEWTRLRRRDRSRAEDVSTELQRANERLKYIDHQLELIRRRTHLAASTWSTRAHEMRQLAESVYESACNVRMTPAETVFAGMGSVVREMAGHEDKVIEFRQEGMETQADRIVLQALKDPVLHLLRNAVSHGAETESQRLAAGRQGINVIQMRMEPRGDRLNLVVEDNGQGVNSAAVISEARRRGLMGETRDPSFADISKFLLQPGFSTSKEITNLSGRGMGLSIVQEAVARLQGEITIRAVPGGGTAIAISVPLAIATQELLLIDAGGYTFGISASFVYQLLRIGVSDIQLIEGRESIVSGGEAIPVAVLADLLALPVNSGNSLDAGKGKLNVLIVSANASRLALIVDAFRDERHAIIKDTGLSAAQSGFALGAIPMEDGTVATVLNVPELFARATGRQSGTSFLTAAPEKKTASIMVVDDSLTTRSLEKSILEAHGYQVRVAVDGLQALEEIRREPPDLVISDVMMPRMTGFELLAELKRDPALKQVPVILVTSLESREEQTRGLKLGADAYIVKGRFDQRELMRVVRQIV